VGILEYFLQHCPKNCTKKSLRRVDLQHIEPELLGLNYQTPVYAGCILKYREIRPKIHFSVDNSCTSKAILKSNISKQVYKGGK
jgi:hypothetical protein